MLRLFAAVKILETGTDDFIDRGRAFRVASERLHQVSSFQRSQRIAGSLSPCVGMGVAVNDRQGFQHPFKINPRVNSGDLYDQGSDALGRASGT